MDDPPVAGPALRQVGERVFRLLGFGATDLLYERLNRVLRARLRETRAASVEQYVALLEKESHKELTHLAEALTINETYFFREPSQWQMLRELLRTMGGGEPVRLLSAGCASGEEAYSLAIAAANTLAGRPFEVLGVDIDGAALETARAGRYPSWAFREQGLDAAAGFIRREGAMWTVDPRIRRLVNFQHLNLVEAVPPGPFHVVFCRNVLMYLTPHHRETVVSRLAESLVPGGGLFVGGAEMLKAPPPHLERSWSHDASFYRRKSRTETACAAREITRHPGQRFRRLLAVGSSTGGPAALTELLGVLPHGLGLAVLVVQHMPAGFTASFAQRLHRATDYEAAEAATGERLRMDAVHVAPGRHNTLVGPGGVLRVVQPEPGDVYVPNVSRTFRSLVSAGLARSTLAVLLTGMGDDGADGLAALAAAGAETIVQDPEEAVVPGMVRAAIERGGARRILRLADVRREVARWARGERLAGRPVRS